MRWALLFAVACTTGASQDRPPPLAPLPPPAPVQTERFRDADACAQCHLVDDSATALHDATGANVSPVLLWRASLMALAARDPYYLAEVAEEGSQNDALCTRCHAPAGSVELADSGGHLTFSDLTTSTAPAALLGRGGVTCTLCHQIDAANLGTDSSFSGGFSVGYARQLYGRYGDPLVSPMQLIVNYTPTLGSQIASSAVCATCHTVIVSGVTEQATYLEWRSSMFATNNQTCQSCHVATVDSAGQPIATVVAGFPAGLAPRTPVGRHDFVGGNSYVLSLLGDATDWANAGVSADELAASAARDDAHLATAAKLSVTATRDPDGTLVVTVRVANQTGHKLPTGYPSRRMWLHVTAGSFESGRVDASGAIVDAAGHALPAQPHRDVVDADDQAQIWEAVMIDANEAPTHLTTAAIGYGKDDRVLPAGFAPTPADLARTRPVGVTADPSFVPGRDDVTYRIANAPAGTPIAIELLYEALRPDIVDALDATQTAAATRFVDLARARPVAPVVLATASATAP